MAMKSFEVTAHLRPPKYEDITRDCAASWEDVSFYAASELEPLMKLQLRAVSHLDKPLHALAGRSAPQKIISKPQQGQDDKTGVIVSTEIKTPQATEPNGIYEATYSTIASHEGIPSLAVLMKLGEQSAPRLSMLMKQLSAARIFRNNITFWSDSYHRSSKTSSSAARSAEKGLFSFSRKIIAFSYPNNLVEICRGVGRDGLNASADETVHPDSIGDGSELANEAPEKDGLLFLGDCAVDIALDTPVGEGEVDLVYHGLDNRTQETMIVKLAKPDAENYLKAKSTAADFCTVTPTRSSRRATSTR
ncbi:hypothetical protein Rt10032_c13g5071 [Rhodotorula toruloides]|uniref:Uncharacterized protein n=1 Tax=Rhodotorula toruloides TaxID=5286 RepID=A0A511KNF2_RHOTO|nr:hypothetical protein Rt10032_c13g5071 [Rhodotorula toruloides]